MEDVLAEFGLKMEDFPTAATLMEPGSSFGSAMIVCCSGSVTGLAAITQASGHQRAFGVLA